jgi:hypothetical protein
MDDVWSPMGDTKLKWPGCGESGCCFVEGGVDLKKRSRDSVTRRQWRKSQLPNWDFGRISQLSVASRNYISCFLLWRMRCSDGQVMHHKYRK